MSRPHSQRGFTLLEILIATAIMGVAVLGLASSITTSMRNASRVSDADRAAQLARNKMEELMVDATLPFQGTLQGTYDPTSGWTVDIAPFEVPPQQRPGDHILQRISLTIWWKTGAGTLRQFPLESYRVVEIPRPVQ